MTDNAEWRLLSLYLTGNNDDSSSPKCTLGESGVQEHPKTPTSMVSFSRE